MDEETLKAAREDHAYATGMQAVLVMVSQARSMDDLSLMIDTAGGIAEQLRAQALRALKADLITPRTPLLFIRFHRRPFLLWSRNKTGWASFVLCGLEVSFPRWRIN